MIEHGPIEENNLDSQEEKFREYNDPREYIKDFEQSIHFNELLNERIAHAKSKLTKKEIKDLPETMRNEDFYKNALYRYHDHNRLIFDRDLLPEKIQASINNYWEIIKEIKKKDRYQGLDKGMIEEADFTKSRKHTAAAGIMSEAGFAPSFRAARALISFMTEAEGLEKADPRRDELRIRFNNTIPQNMD